MTDHGPPIILGYATPGPTNRFARLPETVIVILAIIVPGLSSSLIRGTAWRCLVLVLTILAAFLFFGPFWGEVLFRHTAGSERGLYPFILICVGVEYISVVLAIRDRRRVLALHP